MKNLVMVALLLAVSACAPARAEQSVPLSGSAAVETGFEAFATLAPVGSYEWELAPSYTKLVALRHRAAARLRSGKIGTATAMQVLKETDAVRQLLVLAQAREGAGDKPGAASLLSAAKQKLADVEVGIDQGAQ